MVEMRESNREEVVPLSSSRYFSQANVLLKPIDSYSMKFGRDVDTDIDLLELCDYLSDPVYSQQSPKLPLTRTMNFFDSALGSDPGSEPVDGLSHSDAVHQHQEHQHDDSDDKQTPSHIPFHAILNQLDSCNSGHNNVNSVSLPESESQRVRGIFGVYEREHLLNQNQSEASGLADINSYNEHLDHDVGAGAARGRYPHNRVQLQHREARQLRAHRQPQLRSHHTKMENIALIGAYTDVRHDSEPLFGRISKELKQEIIDKRNEFMRRFGAPNRRTPTKLWRHFRELQKLEKKYKQRSYFAEYARAYREMNETGKTDMEALPVLTKIAAKQEKK